MLDGCEYAEQLQAVSVEGGVAANVVPDEATVVLNHRFAPDRTVAQAESAVRELLAPYLEAGDHWELVDASAGRPAVPRPPGAGRPGGGHRGRRRGPRSGWTDVASFWAHGVPAANFGPADPLLAHTPGEHVSADELAAVAAVLEALLTAEI